MERAAPPAISPSHGRRLEGNDMMKSPPSCLKSGNVKVYLKKWSIWDKFYNLGTEMRMSKRGRFMFPYCEYSVSGLDPEKNYIMAMDISPVDNYRYRYNGCKWQINGKATPHVMGRLYFHPNGSVSGKEWMVKPVSFAKLRLTNCPTAEEGNAILHSMHRYIPQLHIIVADGIIEKLNLNDPRVYTFVFQQTEFFAVTKYENKFIRQLKHFYNPYGTALRDVKTSKQDVANSRRPRKRCEKKPLFNAVKIHGTTNDQESKEELKTIIPIKDGAIKIHENMNNQGPMKQMREIMPVENVLQIEGSFSFKGSLGDIVEIGNLEQKLRDDLRWNGTHEILHPALQKSGIKLSDLQLTECLNVKHLGLASVQSIELNSSFPVNESHGIRETGIPFISRTGKTNDLTKIKGWKHKFNLQPGSPDDKLSPSPSSASTAVIKNRSAFVSDLLDEYLEKEGKIIEQQSLLYDYEMPEIGCQTPIMLDSSCNIQQNTTRSPDFGTPLKNKSSHLEMSPVLEKHFSVTNKGIFIRDVQSTSMDVKARCKTQQNINSAAKRPKVPSPYANTSELSNNKQTGIYATSPQKKQLKSASSSLKIVQVVSSPKGGKKSDISGDQTEAIYISDGKTTEELEPRCIQVESASQATLEPPSGTEHPSTTVNRSTTSKAVEVISYCTWNESRVKIIKLIAECAMANKLPSTQRLDKYEIHLEKRDGTLLFPPKKNVDVRATIQNFSDSECTFDKPLVQTMVIEAVVGNSAFKTKLNHLISKVSKNSSNQQLNSPVHVVMDLEKSVSPPEKCPSEMSCDTTLSNSRLTAEDKVQSFPATTTQKREQGVSIADTTVKNVSKAPCPSIRSAVTTFQKIGALSTLLTNTTPTPIPSCFMNSVASQNKPETPSTPATRYLLCKTNPSGLSSGSTHSLDQDGRRHCIAVPNTLKLQPGENLMLQPIKAADGRQLYKHSSGKIFQLVYTKTPEQTPVQQLNVPQSPILGTSPLVEILTSTATTLTHSNSRSRDGFGNLVSQSRIPSNSLIVNNLTVPHRGFFQNPQSFSHLTKRKVFEPSILCEARKKAILHNLRERESRRMMENRFKILKNKLFDDKQIASKGAILDEAIDVITNLDRQSKNLTMEKELLLGKQKILLEKISLLSAEMGPVVTQGGIEAGEIIETSEALNFLSGGVPSSQNSFGMKWFPEDSPLDALADHRGDCGETVKCEVNSTSSDDIVAVKVGDYFNEKYNSELDYSGGTNVFAVKSEENLSQEDCSTVSSVNEECSGSSKFCSFSDFSTDMEALNKMSMEALGCSEPPRSWIANRTATPHTLRERESRKLMENRFKLLESTVFNDKKAPKGAILIKAIDVISDLDMQSEELFREKELLMKKQKRLLEEISLLADTRSDATEEQVEDGQFFGTKKASDARAVTFQKPSDPHWLENSYLSDAAVIKSNTISVLSEHHSEDCTGGVKWEQDELKANSLVKVKMAGDFKEQHYQEPMNPDGYDPSAVRRKNCNGKDEDALFTVGKESSIGSSDFGSHSDFDINTDEVNEIDVEILSHSESENVDIEMEDGEVADETSTAEKLCAPPRWHFHNYSQSPKFALRRKIYNVSELRKSRKNPLLHTIREREWRKLMQKRFNELRRLLFEDERVSKRAILDEAISEIQNLCQQGQKLYLEKKLLMKKHKALLKIISVLSGEKKLKNQKNDSTVCEKNSGDSDHNGTPVSPGQSLSSVMKGNNEESTLVPIAGTPFHLLLEKIAVSPQGEEFGERDCISQTEMETHSAFSEGYSQMSSSSTQPREEMVMQKLPNKLGTVSGAVSTAIDVVSRNLKILQRGEQHANAMDQNFKSTKDLLPSVGDLKKPTQGALYWSKSISKDYTAGSLEKDQTDSRSVVKGKLQVIRSTKGQDILQKLAKKVQEAGIKPWTWKSKREDSENASQNLFDSESKTMQCFQKASTSISENPITQYVYTETTELLMKDKSLHNFLPGQTLKQNSPSSRGAAEQREAELDMDSDGSTTATCAVREPKIFISSVDIHSANEANANGGYLLLDSTQ
ncbi:uncharacterized protein LOC144671331 isoform X4 [Cetorhinus maximus]